MSGFYRITKPAKIKEALRAYMLSHTEQEAPFLATIFLRRGAEWNGRKMLGGLIIEGARPLSASTDAKGQTTFFLTNSDSGYSGLIGSVKDEDILYVETLRRPPVIPKRRPSCMPGRYSMNDMRRRFR